MMQNVSQKLDQLISDLDRLIAITEHEIVIVSEARHSEINNYEREKSALLRRFESNKEALNAALMRLTRNNPDQTLEMLLDKETQMKLEIFKTKLQHLHTCNKTYGKFVATLGEFFSSLVTAILPMQEEGYSKKMPKPAAFLEVSA
jgi:hypothetical protein